MDSVLPYFLLAAVVYSMNVAPAFMPSTWIVLAFFDYHYKLAILPVVLVGVVMATLGRITLYYISTEHSHRFLPKKSVENMETLGLYLNRRMKITIPLFLIYAFLPIPSNQVYIGAGIAKMKVKFLATCFFFGRMFSYFFWVSATHIAINSLEGIFSHRFTKMGSIVLEIIGFAALYLFTQINWAKILKIKEKTKL